MNTCIALLMGGVHHQSIHDSAVIEARSIADAEKQAFAHWQADSHTRLDRLGRSVTVNRSQKL